MQPGFRTLARARRPDALETLFADETAVAPPRPDAPQAPRPIEVVTPRPIDDLDLQLFAEERVQPPRPSRRVSWPTISGSSPYVVALLVALFTVASPFLLSQQTEPERSDPLTVVAQQASGVAPSIPDLPVATTSEAIVEPSAPPPSAPSAAPAARSSTSRAPAKPAAEKPVATKPVATKPVATKPAPPPPVREPTLTSTPTKSLASVPASPPPQPPAVIPVLQPATRSVETLGTLPVSLVAPPAPPPSAVDARPRGPAAEGIDERAAVLATLRRYEAAYSALDARAVRTVWPSVNQGALSRAFESLAAQNIRLGNCAVTVRAPTARAICAGTATWVPRIGGGKPREDRRTWTFSLAQRDQAWSIVSAEMR